MRVVYLYRLIARAPSTSQTSCRTFVGKTKVMKGEKELIEGPRCVFVVEVVRNPHLLRANASSRIEDAGGEVQERIPRYVVDNRRCCRSAKADVNIL